MDESFTYDVGKRDAFCEMFMAFRLNGREEVLKKIAEQLKDNPHAKEYLKTHG